MSDTDSDYERRVELLIRRLPMKWQDRMRRLRHPSNRLWRVIAGVVLCLCSLLWFLPVLGIWMLPLGMILLAEDIVPIRRLTNHCLAWVEEKRPHWLGLPRRASPP